MSSAVLGLIASANSAGHSSVAITSDDPADAWLGSLPKCLHPTGPGVGPCRWSPGFRPALERELGLCDIAIVHGLWQYHAGATRRACLRRQMPYLVFPHGMLDPWSLKQSWLKRLKKFVAWHLSDRKLLRDASRVCFTCEEERDAALPALKGVTTQHAIVPLGVEEPDTDIQGLARSFRTRNPSVTSHRIFLFLGRLHPKKGCHLLIQGFARWRSSLAPDDISAVHLRLAGPSHTPEYLGELHNLCVRNGLALEKAVSFPGMISRTEIWQELAAAEVMVLPSHQENYGMVVGESLAVGTPVLLSDKVNTHEWVTTAGAGLSSSPSEEGVYDLLSRWSAVPADGKRLMGVNARSLYEKRFSMKATLETFLQVVAEVCEK